VRADGEDIDADAGEVRAVLTEDELVLIANALNEVTNGIDIDDDEFSLRLGADRSEARRLLADVKAIVTALTGR